MSLMITPTNPAAITLAAGQSIVVKDMSGASSLLPASLVREDASARIGAGFFVYGPATADGSFTLSTTGQSFYSIVQGDPTPANAPMLYDPTGPTMSGPGAEAVAALPKPLAGVLGLPKFRQALNRVRRGGGSAKLIFKGESHVLGSGSTGVAGYPAGGRALSYPVQYAALLAQAFGVRVRTDGFIGFGKLSGSQFGPFWGGVAYGAGWSNQALDGAPGYALTCNTAGAAWSYTPQSGLPWNKVDIFYAKASSQGTFRVELKNSVGAVVVSQDIDAVNATADLGKASVTAPAPGLYTIVITKLSTSANYFFGLDVADTTSSEVQVVQCGVSGALAADYSVATKPWDGVKIAVAMAPDGVVLELGTNDWYAGTNTTTFSSSVTSIITALKAVCSVAVESAPPSDSAIPTSTQLTYVDLLSTAASNNGCQFIDTYRRIGSRDYALAEYTDDKHGGRYIYSAMAQDILNISIS